MPLGTYVAMIPGTFGDVSNPLIQIDNDLPNSEPYLEFVNKEDDGQKWGAVNNGVAEWVTTENTSAYMNAVAEYIKSTYDLTPFDDIYNGGHVDFATLPSEWTEL